MGEYAAFPYLNHKVEDKGGRVQFVSGPKELTFEELYSPRDKRNVLYKGEKSYWRTRDRIGYCSIEDRKKTVLIITCKNLETKEAFRTIFLKLDVLYFEVDSKARDNRDGLTRKKDKGLEDDKALNKAVVDYCLARLNIKADPMPWPTSFAIVEDTAVALAGVSVSAAAAVCTPPIDVTAKATAATAETKAETPTAGLPERMCTFDKLSSDVYEELEVVCPSNFTVDEIENMKMHPAKPVVKEIVAAEVPPDEIPAPTNTATDTAAVTAATGTDASTTTSTPVAVSPPAATKTAGKPTSTPSGKKVAPAPTTAAAATSATKTVPKKGAAPAAKPTKGISSKKVAPM